MSGCSSGGVSGYPQLRVVAGCVGGCGGAWSGRCGSGWVVGSDDDGVSGAVTQSGTAAGGASLYQVGRDLSVRSGWWCQ
jgi:hypothetical protein